MGAATGASTSQIGRSRNSSDSTPRSQPDMSSSPASPRVRSRVGPEHWLSVGDLGVQEADEALQERVDKLKEHISRRMAAAELSSLALGRNMEKVSTAAALTRKQKVDFEDTLSVCSAGS